AGAAGAAGDAAARGAADADAATRDALLRCWVREREIAVPATGPVTVPLADGRGVTSTVRYRSATGLHEFGPVRAADDGAELTAAELAALLVGDDPGTGADDLVARVVDSTARIGRYLDVRRTEGVGARTAAGAGVGAGTDEFLGAEQDLLLGHLLHPAAKSRDGLSDTDDAAFAPELRGRFPLHWFAVHDSLVRSGSVVGGSAPGGPVPEHPSLAGRSVPELLAGLSGVDSDRTLVPAHPWQARDLPGRPGFRALLDAGLVTPLGPAGPDWYPTSSLRTVYRPDQQVMLKLSLGLRITNSRRENTHTELVRGIEVHRLLEGGIADAVHAAYPGFRIVRDPGYLAVTDTDGGATHLDVSLREVPAGLTGTRCLAGLVAPHPGIGPARLVGVVRRLARATGRPVSEVAREWVRRYVDHVLAPMVYLYASTGIGLEAHQQNTLVRLDADGWPAAGWYRDNQGYYLAESALPVVLSRTGEDRSTLALAPDRIVDDRLTYYLLLNQALAPVATLGAAGVADEHDLLRSVRDGLAALVQRGHDTTGGLAERWLTAERLPCKANLATRLAGIDEVLAPVDNQSVYVTVPNPLREAAR
ncbi:MAG: IucA/IucC family protein, partial [Actinocatenispora sp.]